MRKHKSIITVKDLAELCGVSRGTIDRALNNRGGISEETRKRVLDTAESYNFIKNQNAAVLSGGKSPLIGVIIFTLNNEFFSTLVSSIEKKARQYGYSVLVMLSGYDRATEIECAEKLASLNVAKLLVCSVLDDAAIYKKLAERGISVVTMLNRVKGLPFVGIDDFAAMYESTRYVILNGYEKICYISPVLSKKNAQNINAQLLRYEGFCRAVSDLKFKNYTLVDNYPDYAAILPQLRGENSCAVICSSDSYTIDCIAALHDTGVGVMGFDRLKVLEKLFPMLSSVQCPTELIGENAVALLASTEAGGNAADVVLPFHIICGSSVKNQNVDSTDSRKL